MITTLSIDNFDTHLLSAKALALISEFALILYRHKGQYIDVESNDVVIKVLTASKHTNDLRLKSIGLHIRMEVANHLVSPQHLRAISRRTPTMNRANR